jgi:peptide/nickel transport system ATP-binding protein
MALVDAQAVWKSYPRRVGLRSEEQTVVEDVSLTIEPGETLGLVGESGSGKTTVARMILGLVEPTRGRVLVDGIDVARASHEQLRGLRRQMQPVFQDPFAALNPRMKVLDIVTEPWIIHGSACGAADAPAGTCGAADAPAAPVGERFKSSRRDRLRQRAVALLREVGLDESALGRYPHEFSGGQRQRINIARALALRPRLLILDEPVSALDVSVGAQIVNLLRQLQRQHGLTYLFISHSMPLVRYLSTRIAVMERGRLVETGEAVALCANPQQAYTRRLLAATPELPARVEGLGRRD